ncbi:hypothetical protein TorRG33x02_275550, partial [Trema orientale]
EPDSGPSAGGNPNCIPLNRINKVETLGIIGGIIVPESPTHHEEIEPMKMNRVVLGRDKPSVLQNQLHRRVVRQPVNLGPVHRRHIRRRSSGEVEHGRRVPGKVSGEDPADVEEMGLEQGRSGHNEGDVVDAGHDPASISGSTSRTWVYPEAHCEEKFVVNLRWHFCRVGV